MPQSPRQRHSLNPHSPHPAERLYAIVDADACASAGRAPADVARAFLSAGARWLQLRCKSMAGGAFLDLADTLAGDAHRAGATLIINDRADIALLSGAHGVHVGQTDLTPDDARRVVGASAIVGLSTHSQAQWDAAVRLPISYVAIGPTFTTETKVTGYAALGLDVVAEVAAVAATRQIPTVAIGGITLGNARSVVEAGAASVAVISDLLNGDPERRCREFLRALA